MYERLLWSSRFDVIFIGFSFRFGFLLLSSLFRYRSTLPMLPLRSIGGGLRVRRTAGKAHSLNRDRASIGFHKRSKQRVRVSRAPLSIADDFHLPPVQIVDLVHCAVQFPSNGFRCNM